MGMICQKAVVIHISVNVESPKARRNEAVDVGAITTRGGNLLAPHDSIPFRFRGQRFDSKPIIDTKSIINSKPIKRVSMHLDF